jgi:mannonate dehydratase
VRTHFASGRGGLRHQSFDFARYDEATNDANPLFQSDERVQDIRDLSIPADKAWQALERVVKAAVPVAEEVGIKLAMHPQDPPMPADADLNVHHVLRSVESLEHFLDLYPSPVHGLNFCQGTVAEMCENPAVEILDAIRKFGEKEKIFMVHFRNIRGGYLNFSEVLPDEGDVNMLDAIRAYRDVGFLGMLCPDHVALSDSDPDNERLFSFCLGYIKGLIQAVEAESRIGVN